MANPYELDKAEHDRRYARIASKALAPCQPQEHPRAIIIGGQPGSGKGKLTQAAGREMFKEGSFVLVDADTLRSRHPMNNELNRINDREAASLTHADASKWAKTLTNDAIAKRANIIIDQTSKSPDSLISRAAQLRDAGYHVELRVMAVKAEISEQRIHSRYENQKAADGAGRYVPKSVHDSAYTGLAESVAAVEREKAVNSISVYDKNQRRIYENTLQNGNWALQPPAGKATLETERNRPLSLQDHRDNAAAYEKLAEQLEKRNATPAERETIEAQRLQATRRLAAETFRQVPASVALKKNPELAGAYAAVEAMAEKVKRDGLNAEQRRVVMARARYNVAAAIEHGNAPQIQREVSAQQEKPGPSAQQKEPDRDIDR